MANVTIRELRNNGGAVVDRAARGEEITHGRAERTTFVITSDGKINAVIGGLRPAENVAQALAVVAQLAKESAKRY